MSVAQIRKELHQFIDMVDPRFLSAIHAMMENYLETDESIVAFTIEGKPLTKNEFIQKNKQAYEEVQKGNFVTSNELLKQMKNW